MQPKTQNWYPLSQLPLFANMAQEMLNLAHGQLTSLERAKNRAHVLDDAMVIRIIKAQTEQNQHAHCVKLQCQRWRQENPTEAQLNAINAIEETVAKIQSQNQQILFLAEHYQQHTIDKLLAMDPAELALAVLGKKIDLP